MRRKHEQADYLIIIVHMSIKETILNGPFSWILPNINWIICSLCVCSWINRWWPWDAWWRFLSFYPLVLFIVYISQTARWQNQEFRYEERRHGSLKSHRPVTSKQFPIHTSTRTFNLPDFSCRKITFSLQFRNLLSAGRLGAYKFRLINRHLCVCAGNKSTQTCRIHSRSRSSFRPWNYWQSAWCEHVRNKI